MPPIHIAIMIAVVATFLGRKQVTDLDTIKEALYWLNSALKCKEWHWDVDQREAAQYAHDHALEALTRLSTPSQVSGELVNRIKVAITPIINDLSEPDVYTAIAKAALSALPPHNSVWTVKEVEAVLDEHTSYLHNPLTGNERTLIGHVLKIVQAPHPPARRNDVKIREFLRTIAPDFMWLSVFDLFLMYEQIDEDVEWDNFRQNFYQVKKKYFVEYGNLYMRKRTPATSEEKPAAPNKGE